MKNNRLAIANHLAIATSTLRRRMKQAERVVRCQPSLFDGIAAIPGDFMPPAGVRRRPTTGCPNDRQQPPLAQVKLFARAYIPIRRI